MKLDPTNTELLSQKQRLLSDAIGDTEKKLEALRQASEKAKSSLESGDIGQEQYDAIQREIIQTERSLESLKTQAQNTDSALKSSTSGLKNLGDAASGASSKVSGISKAAGGLAAGAAATVPATQELRRDLSFLEQNAKEAGIGLNSTEQAFKTFNAVSGETDSSVEAVSNLLQAGFTESNLQIAVEGVSGAMSRFPDTLKIESLADSIQETVATGKSIGQFSEYLDRAGIGAENFDIELAKCNTTAEKADLVLQTLADTGANDTYDAWRKNNKALADYDDAMLDMQMALGDLAEAVAPAITALAEFGSEALEKFNKLPKSAKVVVGGLVGIAAATGPVLSGIGKVSLGLDALTKSGDNAGIMSKGFSSASKGIVSVLTKIPTPIAAAAGALAVLGTAIYSAAQSMNQETKAAEEMSKTHEKNIANIEAQSEKTEFYAGKLDELSQKENKTAQDKQTIQAYVDKLNESVEGLNLTYDEEADKLSQTKDEIYKKIDAMKEEAIHAAYIDQSKEALDKYAESQIKLTDAQEKANALQEEWDGLSQSEKQVRGELGKQLQNQKAKVDDLKTATSSYWQEYTEQSNQAMMASGQWDELVEKAGLTGKQIPENLMTGIKNGSITIPTTVQALNDLITFDKAVTDAGMQGTEIAQNLTTQLSNGEISVQDATSKLTNAVDKELASEVPKAGSKGSSSSSAYAGGVSGGKGKAASAGTVIGQAAANAAASVDFYSGGYNDGKGYANGLRGAIGVVAKAGAAIARAALDAAKAESDQHSPSKKWAKSAKMDVAGYVNELNRQIPNVERAGAAIEKAAMIGATSMPTFGTSAITQASPQQFDYSQMYNAMKAASRETQFTIVLDGRELGRGLRGMGVQFK